MVATVLLVAALCLGVEGRTPNEVRSGGVVYASAPQERGAYAVASAGGPYNYGYNTGDGIAKVEVKQANGAVWGSYRYFDPNGKQVVRTYIADENGFRVMGNDLPISPDTPASQVVGTPAFTSAVEGTSEFDIPPPLAPGTTATFHTQQPQQTFQPQQTEQLQHVQQPQQTFQPQQTEQLQHAEQPQQTFQPQQTEHIQQAEEPLQAELLQQSLQQQEHEAAFIHEQDLEFKRQQALIEEQRSQLKKQQEQLEALQKLLEEQQLRFQQKYQKQIQQEPQQVVQQVQHQVVEQVQQQVVQQAPQQVVQQAPQQVVQQASPAAAQHWADQYQTPNTLAGGHTSPYFYYPQQFDYDFPAGFAYPGAARPASRPAVRPAPKQHDSSTYVIGLAR